VMHALLRDVGRHPEYATKRCDRSRRPAVAQHTPAVGLDRRGAKSSRRSARSAQGESCWVIRSTAADERRDARSPMTTPASRRLRRSVAPPTYRAPACRCSTLDHLAEDLDLAGLTAHCRAIRTRFITRVGSRARSSAISGTAATRRAVSDRGARRSRRGRRATARNRASA
jgi:hypothetical protein